ncbi:MAG: serine/threonine-protein kinase [Planctomycetota bacterium]
MGEFDSPAEDRYLGPYKIDKIIGRGGMGSVYRAHHASTGEEVAIKLIAQHVADDARFRRRFDAEVETLKRLRHDGIVRLIGYGEEDGRLFYSMEMVHGQPLQQHIRKVKRMSWLASVDIAIQICAALKHAHDIGVIHRDLKPANLLLTDAGDVKLVDFGIAKLFGFGEQTLSGSVLGTADYMAPEQAGTGSITTRTDLYAVGSVMYAMMAGRSPFSGKNVTQVIESLQRDRPVPLDLINPDVPTEVVAIVHQLLEKAPEDRPPTALAVLNRLKANRAGLQRQRTIGPGGATQVGHDDHADVDLAASETSDTLLTGSSQAADPDGQTSSTGSAPHGKTVPKSSRAGVAKVSEADREADGSLAVMVESDDFAVPTHTRFETVDERSGTPTAMLASDEASGNRWLAAASSVVMVLILVGGGWLFWQSVKTPSADQLHAALSTAATEGNLTMNMHQIARFLDTYPNDARVDQVRSWQNQAILQREIRRLEAKARAVGGTSQLSAVDQSFLRAMQMRQTSGKSAVLLLQAWLDVFAMDPNDAKTDSDPTRLSLKHHLERRHLDELTELVEEELRRLKRRSSDGPRDDRVSMIENKMDEARKWDPSARRRLLRGIIALYGDVGWAKDVVLQARDDLADISRP